MVNCLAVSPSGNFVVSGSHDRSVRLWEKSDEILVLSEEQEMVRIFSILLLFSLLVFFFNFVT